MRRPRFHLGFVLSLVSFAFIAGAAPTSFFPFSIQGDRFLSNGVPVFLQIISYQPLEPGQPIDGEIREARVRDDLRRLRGFQGGSDPILLRVYAQPTAQFPVRMPKSFYDGLRELGFWIVRDIYFQDNYQAGDALTKGKAGVDAVLNEVAAVGGFDRIFAWEIGNEFRAETPEARVALENFVCAMASHIRSRMSVPGREGFSKWVTWASWVRNDPLRTIGNPVLPGCLDYVSYNAYSFDPERLRDHQAGPGTGRPFAGYLAALKERYRGVPLVISETGLADSVSPGLNQSNVPALYPAYRYGGLTSEQVAEGLADRYWDARLSETAAGVSIFEWNEEWHKAGDPNRQADDPEEHFGLLRFNTNPTEARFKLQAETVRRLFTLQFQTAALSLIAETNLLSSTGTTTIRADVPAAFFPPIHFRWETSRGFVIGDAETVRFEAGGRALGPALVTAMAIDAQGHAARGSVNIAIQRAGPPSVRILTLGQGSNAVARASGRVENVDLTAFKLAAYIQTDRLYVQPYEDMKSIWIQPDGYWWTPVDNRFKGRLVVWLVPNSYSPPPILAPGAAPPGSLASAAMSLSNDADNDLLPDSWEPAPAQGRYDDPDGDGANNLEEFLAGTAPSKADNDSDADGLPDNWERLFFGTLRYGATDDPDNDGLDNARELRLGTHPGRAAVDRDGDELPDDWEWRWFGSLDRFGGDDADGDGRSNLDAFALGLAPLQALPVLRVKWVNAGSVQISWQSTGTKFTLETNDNLSSATAWLPFAAAPVLVGDQLTVNIAVGGARQFYRLRRP